MEEFITELERVRSNVRVLESLTKRPGRLVETQMVTYRKLIRQNIETLDDLWHKMKDRIEKSKENNHYLEMIKDGIEDLQGKFAAGAFSGMVPTIQECMNYHKKIIFKAVAPKLDIKLPKIPMEIEASIAADIHELQKCFQAEAYRSCLILCGRILETALHRKHFEKTKIDLLEQDPTIGIGKLIKKLNEAGILYPGLNEQIDMINQLRVYSVHKKRVEQPINRDQAYASILFTTDVLGKLFAKG